MLASSIWLVLSAAAFGLVAGLVVPFLIERVKRGGFVKDELTIRLKSGRYITSNVHISSADFNALVGSVITASHAQNDVGLDVIARREGVLSEAFGALKIGKGLSPGEIQKITEEVANVYNENPLDKRAAILMARILVELCPPEHRQDGLQRAIDFLSDFVKRKLLLGELDSDYATILYNLACYELLLSTSPGIEPERQRELRDRAIWDLKESVAIEPANAVDATMDADFSGLKDEPSFTALLQKAGNTPEQHT